jgi:hypothetical protein
VLWLLDFSTRCKYSPNIVPRDGRSVSLIFSIRIQDGDVRTSDGKMIRGDAFFTPEVYWEGMYRPVCFKDMEGAASVADAVCHAAGFNEGARVVTEASKTFDRDAMPVAIPSLLPLSLSFYPLKYSHRFFLCRCKLRTCAPGEPLSSCLKAEHEVGMEISTECKAGNAVGIEIACNYQVGHAVCEIYEYIKDLILRARALPSLSFFNTASVDQFLNSTKRTWPLAIHS